MASIRELAANAIKAGFTGKNIPNAPTVKPSPRRKQIGNTEFDELGKRQQKIIRRMAVQGDKPVLDLLKGWQLVSRDEDQRRRCHIRNKDAYVINQFRVEVGFSAMLDAVRLAYL